MDAFVPRHDDDSLPWVRGSSLNPYHAGKLSHMARLAVAVVLLSASLALAREPVPQFAFASQHPDAALVQARSLIDRDELTQAESAARSYVTAHRDSADAHSLLAFVLLRQGNARASLAEFDETVRLRQPTITDLQIAGADSLLLEDYPAAVKSLSTAVELSTGDSRALSLLGRAQFGAGQYEASAQSFLRAVKADPKNALAYDQLGRAYERLGKPGEALGAYRAAVAMEEAAADPDAAPYLHLGALLASGNKQNEAIRYLDRAAQIAPSDASAHLQLGRAYLAVNQLPQAQTELERAAALAPRDVSAHTLLAELYGKLDLRDKARAETERAAELSSAELAPEMPLEHARSLLEAGRPGEAEQETRRYLEGHSSDPEAHSLLGYLLFREQQPGASLAEYTEAAKYRRPTAADLQVVASDYVLLGDYVDADKWFSKAVEWEPKNPQLRYHLGRTKYSENRFAEAVRAFTDCLKLDPKNVKAEDNLGLSYEGLGRTDDAIAAYQQAIAWQADNSLTDAGPYINLGSILVDNNRLEEAIRYLTRATAIAPRDGKAHRAMGKAYLHLNRVAEARAELETAVELEPRNAPLHFMLGQAYRKQGLREKAKAEFDRYAALTGTHSTPQAER
jgi:tetratricopeptide (TPR) repeat protein